MYGAGADHPLRPHCLKVLSLASAHPQEFVTNAEVLQEILHRFLMDNRREDGISLVVEFARLMRDRIEPVIAGDVLRAAQSARTYPGLSARDLLHLAVMQRLRVSDVVSADTGFDAVRTVVRRDPASVETWAGELGLV